MGDCTFMLYHPTSQLGPRISMGFVISRSTTSRKRKEERGRINRKRGSETEAERQTVIQEKIIADHSCTIEKNSN